MSFRGRIIRSIVRRAALLAGAVAVVGIAGCRQEQPRTVAYVGVMTLPKLDVGTFVRGAQLAFDSLNAAAANGTPKLVLRLPDTTMQSALTVAASQRDDPEIIAAIGPERSQTMFEAMPILADEANAGANAIPIVAALASSPGLAGRSPWFFRICAPHDGTAAAAGRAAAELLHARTAVLVFRADVGGREWERGFASAFEQKGGRIVHRLPQLDSISSWPRYAAVIARLHPDVIAFSGAADEAATLLRELDRLRDTTPLLGTEEIGDLGARAVRASGGDVWYTDIFPARAGVGDSATVRRARAFAAAYAQRNGAEPDQFAAYGYDAALVVGSAIQKAGASRPGVRAYLETLGRTAPAIAGVTGLLGFDVSHERTNPAFAVRRLTR